MLEKKVIKLENNIKGIEKVLEKDKNKQEKYNELINSKKLDKILDCGRDKASLIAYEKYNKLKNVIGLHR